MASINPTYAVSELPKDSFALSVKIGGKIRIRLWLALRLIKIAAFMLNGRAEITRV